MACTAFLQPYINWIQQGAGRDIHVYGVSSRSDIPESCYYLKGEFDAFDGTQLTGNATQYFNDRVSGNQKFDANATDNLGLVLYPNGPLMLILESWGNVQMTYTIECKDGLLVATSGAIMLLMSFREGYIGDDRPPS